jgi:molybdopterin synthase sulfur carrier subunit
MITVLFFGPVSERVGATSLQVEHQDGMTLQDLRDCLSAKYPLAFEIVCFTAVNGEQVHDLNLPLANCSEIAFMAKFSGG